MSFDSLRTVPATIVTAGRVIDRYGNDIADWDNVIETEVAAWIGPSPRGGRPEAGIGTERRDEDKHTALLFLDLNAVITNRDRVVVDSTVWEVDAPVVIARTPRGPHHQEVQLRAVEG